MCGFVGVYSFNGHQPINRDVLTDMRDILTHRGPDDSGLFIDGRMGLGFRRLSIIDLDAGHQPMTSEDGRYTIVFNGEIFNYLELKDILLAKGATFGTHSDTEVLLKAYVHFGADMLQMLNGMFAFAVWDRDLQHLFIARDRLGIKPFYYYYDRHRIVFASEIKAILADRTIDREPNYKAIADYLSYSYIPDEKTFFHNIYELLPGYSGSIDSSGHLQLEKYWDVRFDTIGNGSEQEYAEELNALLRDSVDIHLRSDVPVGCHLSGGLDSSTVTCLASHQAASSGSIHTFSGKFTEDPYYDETLYAKMVSSYAHTSYHETSPDASLFYEYLHKLVWHMDQPAVGPGIVPQYAVCKLASEHVKVVLGGQGGDEIFGGYPRYWLTLEAVSKLEGQPGSQGMPPRTSNKIRYVLQHAKQHGILTTVKKVLNYISKQKEQIHSFEDAWNVFSRSNNLQDPVFTDGLRQKIGSYNTRDTFLSYVNQTRSADPLSRMLYHDIKTYLRGLLQVEDRTSMAVSIESRVPLLDYRIVELAAAVPSSIKLKNSVPKHLFKQAIKGIIPEQIRNRKDKKGFPTPIHLWLKQKPEFVQMILSDKAAIDRGLFNQEEIQKLMLSKEDKSWTIWALLNVELWFKIFIDEDPRFVGSDGLPVEKVDWS
ncbi:asparagine synthase (glutamine-hydrolyzing) [Paenibacillus naphthalenovorans]|uniref:asparagine synthase (glutamine-hydrolyzing) n=1 Tax=Paenibacillus naphthalenovorans TaxID=162209 RepID=UPI003D2BA257